VADEQEKTHVMTTDCIITEIGRCEAGTMISEQDVLPSTWSWLQERNFLKSVEEIEHEADEADEPEGDDSKPPVDSTAGQTESQSTDVSKTAEGDDSKPSAPQTESPTAGADEAPEAKKPTGGKPRK